MQLERPECTSTTRVYNTLWNTLMIKPVDLQTGLLFVSARRGYTNLFSSMTIF